MCLREEMSSDRDGSRTVETVYDEETPASIAVIQAICSIEDVDPGDAVTDLGITLYDHVDPGALDAILATGDGDGSITIDFSIDGYRVRIWDTGQVRVRKCG